MELLDFGGNDSLEEKSSRQESIPTPSARPHTGPLRLWHPRAEVGGRAGGHRAHPSRGKFANPHPDSNLDTSFCQAYSLLLKNKTNRDQELMDSLTITTV